MSGARQLSLNRAWRPQRMVSGGQTGVDRGALDAAGLLGIEHGGWCPRGRRAEDGIIPAHYRLREHSSEEYAARTELNIRDSDATLILYEGRLAGGTLLTKRLAELHRRPCLVVKLSRPGSSVDFESWLTEHRPVVLNIAGPRESARPGIACRARDWLVHELSDLRDRVGDTQGRAPTNRKISPDGLA
jgi:hypothetical protein